MSANIDILYKRIKLRRQELNMSQEELARKVGYKTKSSINKIESGQNGISQSKIYEFAKALRTIPTESAHRILSDLNLFQFAFKWSFHSLLSKKILKKLWMYLYNLQYNNVIRLILKQY